MEKQPARLIIIEGNIASGKSTLTTELAARLGYAEFQEPTLSNIYLEDFYKGLLIIVLTLHMILNAC